MNRRRRKEGGGRRRAEGTGRRYEGSSLHQGLINQVETGTNACFAAFLRFGFIAWSY